MDAVVETSLFEPRESRTGTWGQFGYEGACCDRAFKSDSVPMLQECIARGWMVHDTRSLDNRTMVRYAEFRKAAQCAAYLRAQGWPE